MTNQEYDGAVRMSSRAFPFRTGHLKVMNNVGVVPGSNLVSSYFDSGRRGSPFLYYSPDAPNFNFLCSEYCKLRSGSVRISCLSNKQLRIGRLQVGFHRIRPVKLYYESELEIDPRPQS